MWHPATFGRLRTHTARLRQWAEAATCGVGRANFFAEPRAERGEGKRRRCWAGSHPPSRTAAPCQNHSPRKAFRVPRASRNFCMCGISQTSEHFASTLQDCGSGQKLQSAAWGAPDFSPSPGPSGGKASEEAAGLDRVIQAELQDCGSVQKLQVRHRVCNIFAEHRAEQGKGKRRS
jgi:hypothetical protein